MIDSTVESTALEANKDGIVILTGTTDLFIKAGIYAFRVKL